MTSLSSSTLLILSNPADSGRAYAITAGDAISDAGLFMSDITTNNVSTVMHGFAPKLPNNAAQYLDGSGNWSVPVGLGTTNASTTAKGIVQEATQAQVNAGTQVGSTGAELYVNPSTMLPWLTAQGLQPQLTITAGSDWTQNDSIYITGNDTGKRVNPIGVNSGSVSNLSLSQTSRMFYLRPSVSLVLSGGYQGTSSAPLTGYIATVNAGETAVTLSGTQAVYGSGTTGVMCWDATMIGSNKFIAIYQGFNTSGAVDEGIQVVVGTENGSGTISVGSPQTLDGSGFVGTSYATWRHVAVASLGIDKAIVFWLHSGALYCQVLTISGTSITTSTPVLVSSSVDQYMSIVACSLDNAANALVVFGEGGTNSGDLYAATVTVSGTTPTVNQVNTLISSSYTGYEMSLCTINPTTVFFQYSNSTQQSDYVLLLTIAGSGGSQTISMGTHLEPDSSSFGFAHLNQGQPVLISEYIIGFARTIASSNTVTSYLFDCSTGTPTTIQKYQSTASSATVGTGAMVKMKPWVYFVVATHSTYQPLLHLQPPAAQIGIATTNVTSGSNGNVSFRYKYANTFSGLTAGSQYYIDDNGQPTITGSTVAPILGMAISSTEMLLQ